MQNISSTGCYRTSVALRPESYRRMRAALKILRRNGVRWSEAQLLSRLGRTYLVRWKGSGLKAASTRRCGARLSRQRSRRPWYVEEVLYALLWQRSVHSGQSVSRMVDFSIRVYLPRILEELLANPVRNCTRSERNSRYWSQRQAERKPVHRFRLITYSCKTEKNHLGELEYRQTAKFLTPETSFTPLARPFQPTS